ncbi:helix-turn-helix domain-containing protein [Thioalkalivibrio sp. ALE23]|uniref:helix-turn-helix domain-containing protein n=1 Tax=Thioalkalivibrio sp. ALE23 TaxID=1265495 RepID=UPI00036F970C|nr:helix-turn-helix domain-containing protein [Thioalkalivibrio sp. ALE23]
MTERRSRDPDLGRVEDVDDTASSRPPLSGDPGVPGPDEPPVAAGLTTRDQPEDDPTGQGGGEGDEQDAQPGRGLRVAREGAGLEIAELSRRTHLGKALLQDLEANRFEHMPPAYVRGYLRSCARELGVDPEPWVQAYDRRAPAEPAPRPVATRRHRPLRRSVWPYWLAAALVVGLLAVATVFWAEDVSVDALREFGIGDGLEGLPALETETTRDEPAGQDPAEDRPRDEPGAGATEGDTSPDTDTDTETGTVEAETPAIGPPEPLARPERDPAAEEGSEETAADTGMDTVPEDAGIDEPVAPAPLDEAGTAGEETDIVEAPEEITGEITEGTTGAAETAPAADGQAELILEVRETSWVEIRDTDGAVVLTGVLSPGTREELQLELPGRAVLGNAAGVELTLNGEPVAFDEHVRDDRTARFDLEE